MHAQPTILPLDVNGRIYVLRDEKGNTIGTGSREVCEVLLYMIANSSSGATRRVHTTPPQRPNVRAAIVI